MFTFNLGFKRWRKLSWKIIFVLLAVEFCLVVSVLALFGIADPDTYRSKLWRDGFINGFNSSPAQPIYDLVNGGSYVVPLVWSVYLTKYNLVIAVLTTFILLAKSVMIIMKVLYPPLSFLIHAAELGTYVYSAYGQTSPDTIDPEHVNNGPPWYITKSCSVAAIKSNVGYCLQAKASFYVTVFMAALFAIHLVLAIGSMLFSPTKREEDQEALVESKGKGKVEPTWEMVPIPETPKTPYGQMPMSPMTPRTKAFQNLQGASLAPYGGGFAPPPRKAKK